MNIRQLIDRHKEKLTTGVLFSRQAAVVVVAAVFFSAGLYWLISAISSDDAALQEQSGARMAKKTTGGVLISAVEPPKQGVRDLFRYTREYVPVSNEKTALVIADRRVAQTPETAGSADAVVSYGGDVVLKGIAKSGITRYALIQYGGKTQIFRKGESFGPYAVISISDGQVVLSSPSGSITVNQQRLQSTAKSPETNGGAGNEK